MGVEAQVDEVELRPLNSAKRWPLCPMHWSKNYLLVSINCLILLGVVLEVGIDCANTLRLHCSRSR